MNFHGKSSPFDIFFILLKVLCPKRHIKQRKVATLNFFINIAQRIVVPHTWQFDDFFQKKFQGAHDVPGKLFHTLGFTNKTLWNGLSCSGLGYDFLFKSNLAHCLHVTSKVQSKLFYTQLGKIPREVEFEYLYQDILLIWHKLLRKSR